jgi:dTDP-4-amino-4,6-dideoxygalactose transaminase
MKLVKKHGIFVIEDAAQSPFSKYGKKKTGTVGHIGGFSLNYHKHIHTGEGGMMVTNNKLLAERMQLIRNHAESVVGPKQEKNLSNMIGFNFRLGEMEAAIGREQLKKLPRLSAEKTLAGTTITNELKKLQGFIPPEIEKGSTHVFYIYGFRIDKNKIGVDREKIVEALKAEGVPWIYGGYQNIHLLPMYQKKIAYGKNGFPWNPFNKKISYKKGICPTAERLHDKELVCLQICQHNYTKKEIDLVIKAFKKVWNNLDKLK